MTLRARLCGAARGAWVGFWDEEPPPPPIDASWTVESAHAGRIQAHPDHEPMKTDLGQEYLRNGALRLMDDDLQGFLVISMHGEAHDCEVCVNAAVAMAHWPGVLGTVAQICDEVVDQP